MCSHVGCESRGLQGVERSVDVRHDKRHLVTTRLTCSHACSNTYGHELKLGAFHPASIHRSRLLGRRTRSNSLTLWLCLRTTHLRATVYDCLSLSMSMTAQAAASSNIQ